MGRRTLGNTDPEWFKKWARRQVRNALRSGRMVKPDACSLCGRSDLRIDAHHEDYHKPFYVEWLCSACHGTRHAYVVQMVRFAFDVLGYPNEGAHRG